MENARDTSNAQDTGNASDTKNIQNTNSQDIENARDTMNTQDTGNAQDTENWNSWKSTLVPRPSTAPHHSSVLHGDARHRWSVDIRARVYLWVELVHGRNIDHDSHAQRIHYKTPCH